MNSATKKIGSGKPILENKLSTKIKQKPVESDWDECDIREDQNKPQESSRQRPPEFQQVLNKQDQALQLMSLDELQFKKTASLFLTSQNNKNALAKKVTESWEYHFRQQTGLSPPTNIRLFKHETKLMQKSILSNGSSIFPCSQSSFEENSLKKAQMQRQSEIFRSSVGPEYQCILELNTKSQVKPELSRLHKDLETYHIDKKDYIQMLDESVKKRKGQLEKNQSDSSFEVKSGIDELSFDSEESKEIIQKSTQTVTLNLESVILMENKLYRIAQNIKHMRLPAQGASKQTVENYENSFREVVELCEEYWYILRIESSLFCTLPMSMFGKTESAVVEPLTRSFILKMMVISILGFLVSNQDYSQQEAHLQYLAHHIHNSFLIFMRVILQRFSNEMFQTNYWARSLQQIVSLKTKRQVYAGSSGGSEISAERTPSAAEQLSQSNKKIQDNLLRMIGKTAKLKKLSQIYDQPLFKVCADIIKNKEPIGFKQACSKVGGSLREDFSEIDSSQNDGDDLAQPNNELRSAVQGSFPLDPNLKPPFLPKIKPNKQYTLVLDLDETLVHYDEKTGEILIRPNAEKFLTTMEKYYEIVIFTAGMQDYADWALSQLGDGKIALITISYRLYRQHALPCREFYIKDLSLLGRDLNKTIIVDNISENFLLQPENGICIKSWYDDETDNALMQLAPLLQQIVQQKVKDVKQALRMSKEQLMKMIINGEDDPMTHMQNLSFSQQSQNSHREKQNQKYILGGDTPSSDKSASTGANQHAAYLDISGIHSTD